jgi:hypothetical protein
VGGRYRLTTTLLDPTTDPADQLLRLYGERWEIESAYFALRHPLMSVGGVDEQFLLGVGQLVGDSAQS